MVPPRKLPPARLPTRSEGFRPPTRPSTHVQTNYPPYGQLKWGHRTRAFLSCSKDYAAASPGPIKIAEAHSITFSAADRDKFEQQVRDCVQLLVDELKIRMPDADVVKAMLVFDARELPINEVGGIKVLPQGHGDKQIDELVRWYAPNSRTAEECFVNRSKLRDEWELFKPGFLVPHSGADYHTICALLTAQSQCSGDGFAYPNILKLLSVAQCCSQC